MRFMIMACSGDFKMSKLKKLPDSIEQTGMERVHRTAGLTRIKNSCFFSRSYDSESRFSDRMIN